MTTILAELELVHVAGDVVAVVPQIPVLDRRDVEELLPRELAGARAKYYMPIRPEGSDLPREAWLIERAA